MTSNAPKRTIISIDAMGGDRGPAAVVAGLALSAEKNPDIGFLLHGDKPTLEPLIAREANLQGRVEIRHTQEVVTMDAKPSHVMRNGKETSMWATIDAVRNHEADVAVSCGNTGALMLLSMVRLRKLPGVNRPAIACLWPSRNPGGFNIMLDVGADIRADDTDLLQYAMMGASYARNGLGIARPRIGLLNVGTEEHKGHPVLKSAHELITNAAEDANIEFVGFVEGVDIPSDQVDVIVTDGFTGNVALKTAEGTANLMAGFIRESFTETVLAKLTALIAKASLGRLKLRMDPRRANGGVFLGLNGTVVKSHGSADPVAISSAVKLAFTLARSGFNQKLAARVASSGTLRQDDMSTKDEEQA
ncbi:phosphate:acyl-[acyl carrier protein] acyltransferase [Aliiroseovarius crassostreae]|uniref:Phosphate acyltransferase n=1 Tax=Aliiroseovarius crassostreae TaxID=154981 RepID=A0A0P7I2B7_9RHOB|nr:phosphate acyltransferase PlsX [Aliiroseovarius crassostreae]KPN63129.1 phosphate acyltransferase [Aliiroseovarius crassostreae]SFU59400.1 phosphate:acyl-[acyl carrier protein] acyltransferase [Aliiroseovarius crassostreae]